MDFKEFIQLSEYAGDGSTILNGRDSINYSLNRPQGLGNIPGYHNDGNRDGNNGGIYTTSDQDGTEQPPKTLQNQGIHPSYELSLGALPSVQVKGTISDIDWFSKVNKSSIGVTVSMPNRQTTRLNLTRSQWDTMRNLHNGEEPKKGSDVTVTLLRHPTDRSDNSSRILGFKY